MDDLAEESGVTSVSQEPMSRPPLAEGAKDSDPEPVGLRTVLSAILCGLALDLLDWTLSPHSGKKDSRCSRNDP